MKNVLLFLLIFNSLAYAKPKYPQDIKPLSKDHAFFRKESAPDYWSLISHYRPQLTGRSCSIASANIILNALWSKKTLTSEDKLFNEETVLEKLKDELWTKNVSSIGKGMMLEELSNSFAKALKNFGYNKGQVAIHFASDSDFRKALIADLRKNETSDNDFIIANFDQGYIMKDEPAGHISPVGAFDSKLERVLILDTDRDWYEPYWVPLDTFINSMNTTDTSSGKTRGYIKINLM